MSVRAARSGFTLLEVVIALLVLEVAAVGVVGALVLASSTLSRAEALELQVAATEGVLDSLARSSSAGADSIRTPTGAVSWVVDDSARVRVRAFDPHGELIVDVESLLGP